MIFWKTQCIWRWFIAPYSTHQNPQIHTNTTIGSLKHEHLPKINTKKLHELTIIGRLQELGFFMLPWRFQHGHLPWNFEISPSSRLFYQHKTWEETQGSCQQKTWWIAGFVYWLLQRTVQGLPVLTDRPSWGWQLKYTKEVGGIMQPNRIYYVGKYTWDIGCKRRLQTYRNGGCSWYFLNLSMTRRSTSSMKAPKWSAKCGEPCVLSSPKPDWANCGDLRRATSVRNSCGCLIRSLRNHLLVTLISCMTSTKTSSMDGVPIRFRYSKSQGRRQMSCKAIPSSKHGLAITVFLHHLAEYPSCAMFERERQVHMASQSINGNKKDPKMEVLYHIRAYFVGIFPYIGIGLKNWPYI